MTARELPAGAGMFVAVARCRRNYYPGTLTETPPDYRRETVSEPMSYDAARFKLVEWASVVKSPGWEFSIEPAALAAAEGGEGEKR